MNLQGERQDRFIFSHHSVDMFGLVRRGVAPLDSSETWPSGREVVSGAALEPDDGHPRPAGWSPETNYEGEMWATLLLDPCGSL